MQTLKTNELFDIFVVYLMEAYKRVAEVTAEAEKEIQLNGHTDITAPLPTVVSIGTTRSGKTVAKAQGIIIQVVQNEDKGVPLTVNCYRNLLTDCATKTFNDFRIAIRIMGLEDKFKFTGGNKPIIRYGKSEIHFLGVSDDENVQQAACHIAYFNEAFEISNRKFVQQVVSRCKRLVIYDGNPTDASHWLFSEMASPDVKVFHSTYKDNRFLSPTERYSIEQYCPWDLKDYIKKDGRWQWTLPEEQRTPNKVNIERGTANRHDWLVKGEGIPAEKEGCIFKVTWTTKLPPIESFEDIGFGLDFGWSEDETSFSLMANRSGNELHIRDLIYEQLKDRGEAAEEKLDYLFTQIVQVFMRPAKDWFEVTDETPYNMDEPTYLVIQKHLSTKTKIDKGKVVVDHDKYAIYVTCETQDRYKDVRFVTGLQNATYREGISWLKFYKISPKPRKYKGVANLQAWKLFVVRTVASVKNFNNFTYKMVGDAATSIIDENKSGNSDDHLIDSSIYVGYGRFRKI